jgi:dimeric dUTPase (all-alpha-NTP-PPase superfamily)
MQREDVSSMDNLLSGLQTLVDVQKAVSGLVDAVPNEGVEATPDQLRSVVLALHVELNELLQQLNWKPWKKTRNPVHPALVAGEFADILAFLGLLIIYLNRAGISVEDLTNAYADKTAVNIVRFKTGY